MTMISFVTMYVDKQKAKKNQWRISEKALLFLAVAGGSIGIYLGMRVFRHKTKHLTFKYGVPLIFLLQFVLISYYL